MYIIVLIDINFAFLIDYSLNSNHILHKISTFFHKNLKHLKKYVISILSGAQETFEALSYFFI